MLSKLRVAYWRIRRAVRERALLFALSRLNPFEHAEGQRKPRALRIAELFYIVLRWDQPAELYLAQKMDLRGASVLKDFYPTKRFDGERDALNSLKSRAGSYFSNLTNDKLAFELYLARHEIPTTITVATFSHGHLMEFPRSRPSDESQTRTHGKRWFCKPVDGIRSESAFVLDDFNELNVEVGKHWVSKGSEAAPVFLVQERIEQHASINALYEGSVNTVRIVTYRDEPCVKIFGAFLRIGAGGAMVDAGSTDGRLNILVDTDTGSLYSDALYRVGRTTIEMGRRHPDTDVEFQSVTIPYWNDLCQVVARAHDLFPTLRTIGWDVALSPDGPIIIEANADWGPHAFMWLHDDFKARFSRLTGGV